MSTTRVKITITTNSSSQSYKENVIKYAFKC